MTEEIDRPSLSDTALLPADASIYRKLFDISFGWWSSLFRRWHEVSIAFPASGGASLALWFPFVAFYMSYPNMVRLRMLLSKWLLKEYVLASDAPGSDFWLANTAPSDGRSSRVGAVRLGWRQ